MCLCLDLALHVISSFPGTSCYSVSSAPSLASHPFRFQCCAALVFSLAVVLFPCLCGFRVSPPWISCPHTPLSPLVLLRLLVLLLRRVFLLLPLFPSSSFSCFFFFLFFFVFVCFFLCFWRWPSQPRPKTRRRSPSGRPSGRSVTPGW